MTLEEAIKVEEAETLAYEECLNSLDDNMPTDMRNEFNKSLGKQMDYHRQLAEWLRELKAYRETYKNYSKVEKMLICEVEKAKENPSVKKPISYGLYQTWKFWDKNEVAREVNADADSD